MQSLINDKFLKYLNGNLKIIQLLKGKIKTIHVGYEFSNAYSNRGCRFYIKGHLKKNQKLTIEEQVLINRYCFDDPFTDLGEIPYVTFIYRSNKAYNDNFDVIKDFIKHYQFAEGVFDGYVKNFLLKKDRIKIKSLSDTPFFHYALKFFNSRINETQKYWEVMHRHFEFDVDYHEKLVKKAEQYNKIKNSISEKEIYETTHSNLEELRIFLINNDIPFSLPLGGRTIDVINIDIIQLKEKLKTYTPYSYSNFKCAEIIKLLTRKENEIKKSQEHLNNLITDSGLKIGSLILVGNYIGLIKDLDLGYNNQLKIKYKKLKIDLQESSTPIAYTGIKNISHFINNDETTKTELLKNKSKSLQVGLFKVRGLKNKKFIDK